MILDGLRVIYKNVIMETDERNDQLKFALDILNHPELLQEEYVQEWLTHEENKSVYEECRLYLEAGLRKEVGERLDVMTEYERFNRKFMHRTGRGIWRWTAAAAAIVIIVVSACWLAMKSDTGLKEVMPMANISSEQVVPGKNEAVLVTESGKTVVLGRNNMSDVEIEAGIVVRDDSVKGINYSLNKNMAVHYHTLKVPKGAEFKIVLYDGTEVWLNSESELRFPTVFTGNEREVELKGEGYFSVTHDDKLPFIVVAAGVRTKVYGTEFNVRSYDVNDVNVTLVKGRVGVQRDDAAREYALTPGENARFEGDCPEITRVNVHKFTAWKEGYFYYENERVETIMNDLKRWYDFDVVYVGNRVKDLKFELWSSRDSNISTIIGLLMKTNKVHMKLEGRTLIVSEMNR